MLVRMRQDGDALILGWSRGESRSVRKLMGASVMSQQIPSPPQQANYPPQAPQKKSHTVRNIFLVLILLSVLFVGGCFALVGAGLNAADKAIKESDNRAGGADNPMAIVEGKAFEVDGFEYASGWKITNSAFGFDLKNLKVTNNREDKDSALVEIKFMRGTEVLASADCVSDPIAVGQTVSLTCLSTDKLPKRYDEITINDTF
jgi:hypothetical protein